MSDIRPIETVYSGYRFRSRLEARWALYFDAMGIEYEYELEGFDLGDLGWYLPDFWLPQVQMWAEVKAEQFSEIEKRKCEALALGTDYPCLLLDGSPALRNYWAYQTAEWRALGMEVEDFLLFGSPYWETEDRFFGSTGAPEWEVVDYSDETGDEAGRTAVTLARRARFDRGNA